MVNFAIFQGLAIPLFLIDEIVFANILKKISLKWKTLVKKINKAETD